jgi:hypothetical protein
MEIITKYKATNEDIVNAKNTCPKAAKIIITKFEPQGADFQNRENAAELTGTVYFVPGRRASLVYSYPQKEKVTYKSETKKSTLSVDTRSASAKQKSYMTVLSKRGYPLPANFETISMTEARQWISVAKLQTEA